MAIILASSSQNRRELLQLAGIDCRIEPSRLDEGTVKEKDPYKRARTLAYLKAHTVAQKHQSGIIVAADTVGLYRQEILEKPKFKMSALETLKKLAGRSHLMITGWCVINAKTKREYQGVVETKVIFRDIDLNELEGYVNDFPVTQWAAAYSPLNTPAITFIRKIEGSLTGFTHGLPLEEIYPVLIKEKAVNGW